MCDDAVMCMLYVSFKRLYLPVYTCFVNIPILFGICMYICMYVCMYVVLVVRSDISVRPTAVRMTCTK